MGSCFFLLSLALELWLLFGLVTGPRRGAEQYRLLSGKGLRGVPEGEESQGG